MLSSTLRRMTLCRHSLVRLLVRLMLPCHRRYGFVALVKNEFEGLELEKGGWWGCAMVCDAAAWDTRLPGMLPGIWSWRKVAGSFSMPSLDLLASEG